MSRPERRFVGWDRPVLQLAAEELVEAAPPGPELDLREILVVVPGARGGRRLLELLVDGAEERGRALVPPRIVTMGRLPEEIGPPGPPVATPILVRRIWARVLRDARPERIGALFPDLPERDDLPGWDGLARIVHELHREVGREGLFFADVVKACGGELLYDDARRWEILASLQARYRRELEETGRVDRDLARIDAVEPGELPGERAIWLVAVADMPGIVRRMLEAYSGPVRVLVHAPPARREAFDELGCVRPEIWREAELPLTDAQVVVADRPRDQASAVVRELDAFDGAFSPEEVTLGVPDEELVPFLRQRLDAYAVPHRHARGVPLPRTAPYRLLEAVADYLDDRRFSDLAALLRHPDLDPADEGTEGTDPLTAADRYFVEHLPARLGDALPGEDGAGGSMAEVLRRLEEDRRLDSLDGRRPLTGWMPALIELLVGTYGRRALDRARPRDRRLLAALESMRDAADALHRLPSVVDDVCRAPAAIRLLLSELRGGAVPPEPDRSAVEMLGWLELHLDDAPALVITGFNEPHLPAARSSDPFLPDALRTRLGLEDNEGRYARDAYYLTAIVHSRRRLRVIAGRRNARGDPLRPSRLLFAVPPERIADRVLGFYEGRADEPRPLPLLGVRPGERSRFDPPPEPEIRVEEPIRNLRVTEFGLLLRDPYRFALRHVRKLEEIDDEAREMDPLRFGSLAHRVLERFGRSEEARSPDARRAIRRLDLLLDTVAQRRFGPNVLPAVRVQVEQLRSRLRAFGRWHAGWIASGWEIRSVEATTPRQGVAFPVDGEEIRIHGRVDRIDVHPETGEWAVFDYKTGESPKSPERVHRRGRGDERAWIDLQLPLYRHLLPALVGASGEPVTETHVGTPRLGYILLPKDPAGVGASFADWSAEALAAADAAARDAVRLVREGVFRFDPTVRSPGYDDPFAELLGRQRLVTAGTGTEGE